MYQLLIIIAGLTGKNLKDKGLVEGLIDSITGLLGLQIVPLTVEDFSEAKNLMGEYGLDFEDALHLASALRYNLKEIISNDLDFDQTPLKRIF
ncbi:MAG: type II toxin-antitoxin system VapC family toxin [Nitrososphaeria archaeon]